MNANELADLIERCNDSGYNQDAANLLRQQQIEISILKTQVNYLESKVYGGTTK